MCNVDTCKVHICINCNTASMTFHILSNEGLLPRLSLLLGGGGPFELHSSRYGLGQGALQRSLREGSRESLVGYRVALDDFDMTLDTFKK